ncbi:MAG: RHS repeat-associated core domain-containing protein [Acidobacteriota bacterium]
MRNNKLVSIIVLVSLLVSTFGIYVPGAAASEGSSSGTNNTPGFLNDVVARQTVTQSDKPFLADRNSTSEYIDPQSGNLNIRVNDLSLPGKDGLDLNIGRYYNSTQAKAGSRGMLFDSMNSVGTTVYYVYSYVYTNRENAFYGPYSLWELADADCNIRQGSDSSNTYGIGRVFQPEGATYQVYSYTPNLSGNVSVLEYLGVNYSEWMDAARYKASLENTNRPTQFYYGISGPSQTGGAMADANYILYTGMDSYLRTRYNLGAGWAFAFPSVQIKTDYINPFGSGDPTLTYYDGTGGTSQVSFTSDLTDSNLIGYQGKEVHFERVTDVYKSYNNGDPQNGDAAYVFVDWNREETYFGADGRLLGILDCFGNKINFKYTNYAFAYKDNPLTQGERVATPFITEIIDSVGRSVYFNYSGEVDGGKIELTVVDPKNTKSQKYTYEKTPYTCQFGQPQFQTEGGSLQLTGQINAARMEPCLTAFIDPEGRRTEYTYDPKLVWGNMNSLNYSDNQCNVQTDGLDTVFLLNSIKYPDSTTLYEYKTFNRLMMSVCTDLQSGGIITAIFKDYTISKRYDMDLRNNGGVTSEGEILNQVDIVQSGDYTSMYSSQGMNYPDDPLYSHKEICNGLITTRTFNAKGQELKSEIKTADDSQIKTIENLSFNGLFKSLPEYVKTSEYDSNSGQTATSYTNTQYNEWGGMTLQQVDGLPPVSYQYTDPNNKYLMTSKQWTQKDGVTCAEYYAYDNKGRVTQVTNAKGEITNTAYTTDTEGKKITVTKPIEGGKTATAVSICGPETNNAYPTVVKSCYTDKTGTLAEVKSTTTYDMLLGLPTTITDAQNHTTVNEYDKLGRVISTKLPNVTVNGVVCQVYQIINYQTGVTSDLFDETNQGLVTTLVETYTLFSSNKYNWHKTYFNCYGKPVLDVLYDPVRGWVIQAQCHYDAFNRLIFARDAEGNVYTYEYDAFNRPLGAYDPDGNCYGADYLDGARQKVTFFNPVGTGERQHELETTFDQLGNLKTKKDVKSGITESFAPDYVGNVTQYTDPKGNVFNYGYDKLNRLTSIKDPVNVKPINYDYTILGNLKTVTIADNVYSWTTTKNYDEMGRLISSVDPANFTYSFYPNSVGQVESSTDPNGAIFASLFDEQGRIKSTTATKTGQSSTMSYGYGQNPFGPSSITFNGTTITYQYNGLGQVEGVTLSGNATGSVNYLYDKLGRTTSVQVPGFTTGYHYDGIKLDQVSMNGDAKKAEYKYLPDGRVQYVTYPALSGGSVLKTEFVYYDSSEPDQMDRVKKVINWKNSAIMSEYQYHYDKNGNIDKVTDITGTTSYTYDALNRIKTISRPGGDNIVYEYDARGNRQIKTGDIPNFDASPVDATFNIWNQLTQVKKGTATLDFQYSPDGLRTKKSGPNGTITYTYNSAGKVISAVYGGNTYNYVWGPDRLLAMKDVTANKMYYYVHNGHGDVVQIMDEAGTVVNQYQYDEWGNIVSQTETVFNEFKYAGEIYDTESGLYYLRARYYDPSVGRFISKDSYEGQIDNPASLNAFTYCENSPMMGVDPSGHSFFSFLNQPNIATYGGYWAGIIECFTDTGAMLIGMQLDKAYGLPCSTFLPGTPGGEFNKQYNTKKEQIFANCPIEYNQGRFAGKVTFLVVTVVDGVICLARFSVSAINGSKLLNVGAGKNPIPGAKNIDVVVEHPEVSYGDVNCLTGIKNNSMGQIVMQNPYKYYPLQSDAIRVLRPGGTMTVTGNMSNPFFKATFNASDAQLSELGLEVVGRGTAPEAMRGLTSNGKQVQGTIMQITFRKK